MKALLHHLCVARIGLGCDAEEIEIEFEVPFLPVAGMTIAPNARSDLMKIGAVSWHAAKPDTIELYAVDDGLKLVPFAYWRKQGWRRGP